MVNESAWALHLQNLTRCSDKAQRDSYLDGVERHEGAEYRRNLQRAWFNAHDASQLTKQAQLATFTPSRV